VCQSLPPEDRCVLFLSFYAELSVRTIARVVHELVFRRSDVELVTLHLCSSWQRVLRKL
jgi:hypothetical protein